MTDIENRLDGMCDMFHDKALRPIAEAVAEGRRLTRREGLVLARTYDLPALGQLASLVRRRRCGATTWYIVNHHINYSNVCKNRCRFCAFRRTAEAADAYVMPLEEVMAEAARADEQGATEIHIVGSLHPELPFEYYLEMIGGIHQRYPQIHLQAFTAVEIAHLADRAGASTGEVLKALKEAGLGSLPGGGAEVFSRRVRELVCPEKLPAADWLRIMGEAHGIGLPSNATMLYGHVETDEEWVDHMLALREQQDASGGFMTFIPLAFHPDNTDLKPASGSAATAMMDLRVMALGRLMLDNIPHIKAFWIMLGLPLAQLTQHFGADDIDGTVVQERITHAAGATTPQALTVDELCGMIRQAGFDPVERNTVYRRVLRNECGWNLAD